LGLDEPLPASDAWHKELLNQMAAPTNARPAVITTDLLEALSQFLAFRHLFRGASIALMRWDKLAPLIARVDQVYRQAKQEIEVFCAFLRSQGEHFTYFAFFQWIHAPPPASKRSGKSGSWRTRARSKTHRKLSELEGGQSWPQPPFRRPFPVGQVGNLQADC
jgi:hypothetical protein